MGPKKTKGIDCGAEAGAWFDRFLGKSGMRLVYCDTQSALRTADTQSTLRTADTQSTLRTADEFFETVGVRIAKNNLKVFDNTPEHTYNNFF